MSPQAMPKSALSFEISPATPADFDAIWDIYRQVLEEGETYSYGTDVTKEEAREYWTGSQVSNFVARCKGEVAGCYALRTNRTGRGSHVANSSYIVNEKFRGNGVGRMLGEHSLAEARRRGYKAIQFNFVVSTNEKAVKLWKSLGFNIAGTLPKGFQHPTKGLVDVYVMHQFL